MLNLMQRVAQGLATARLQQGYEVWQVMEEIGIRFRDNIVELTGE